MRLQKILDDCQQATDISLPSIAQQLKDNVDTANGKCMSKISDSDNYGFFKAFMFYRIYSRISRKIYDKILTEKLGGDLSAGHKI